MKHEKVKEKKRTLRKGRIALLIALPLVAGLFLSFAISTFSSYEAQTSEVVIHKSPLIWRTDGEGDYLLSELVPGGTYELTKEVETANQIETITVTWKSKGEVALQVSANNGQDYTPVVYGVPLDLTYSGNRIKWKVTLGEDSELTEVKIAYTDISGAGGTFGSPQLSGFKFRKQIYINRGQSPEGTVPELFNYQIPVLVARSDASVFEAQVDCEGNVKADFADIRFTAADGETPLAYYLESITGDESNRIAGYYVRVPQIPGEGLPIYIYYGNPDAEDLSGGEGVFDFFDDFTQDEPDLEKWEAYTDVGGSYGLSGSQLKLDGTKITSRIYRIEDGIIEYQAKAETPLDSEHLTGQAGFESRLIIRTGEGNPEQVAYSSAYEGAEHCLAVGDIVKKNQAKPISAGVVYRYKVEAHGDDLTFKRYPGLSAYEADSFEAEVSYTDKGGLKQGYIGLETGEGSVAYYDWLRVRKFAETEPYISASADEEEVKLAEFSGTALAGNGNIIRSHKAEDTGEYITAPLLTACNISVITPAWITTNHELSIDISADGGASWEQGCESARAYSAPFDFSVGKELLLRANFPSDALTDTSTQSEIEQIKLEYSTAPVVTSANTYCFGATGEGGVYILGDAIIVEWDNSAAGDNNPDILSVSCNLEPFGGDAATGMYDDGNDDVYAARYELPEGINTTTNIFITVTNICGMATRDGHILTVNTTAEEAVLAEAEEEEAEEKPKDLRKRYKIKFGEDEAEIGDFETEDFRPHVKLKRWGEECFLSIEFPDAGIAKEKKSITSRDGRIEWDSPKVGSHFYKKAREEVIKEDAKGKSRAFTINENDGLEFELLLKEIPASNVFTFPIKSEGLKFYYQGFLTGEEIAQGAVRPDEVVGSYAIYHESKKDGEYKTGKAFHIYRPKIIDANEGWVWGELNIDEAGGVLTITIDRSWLNSAAYPVIIDPTIGYGDSGGTSIILNGVIKGSVFTGVANRRADSISAYLQNADVSFTHPAKYAIYLLSGLSLVDSTAEATIPISSTDWYSANFSSPPNLSAVDYVLAGWADNDNILIHYDEGDADQGHTQTLAYGTWPDPLVSTTDTNKYSIYTTYEEAVATFVITVTLDDALPTVSSVTASPVSPAAGDTVTFTITFNEDMDTSVAPVVKFGLSDPYTTYTVSAAGGYTSATVWEGTAASADTEISGDYHLSISGAKDEAGNAMAADTANAFTITPLAAASYFALSSPADITAGNEAAYTVTRHDQYDNLVTSGAQTVYLFTDSAGANAQLRETSGGAGVASVSIADTTSAKAFYYYDELSGTYTITASDATPADAGVGIVDDTDALTVVGAAGATLDVSGIADPATAGTASDVVVSSLDAYGNITTDYTGKIHFTSSDAAAVLPEDYWFVVPAGVTETSDTDFGAAGAVLDQAAVSGTGAAAGVELGVSSYEWVANSAWDTPTAGWATAPAFADLDNDGDYDLLIGNQAGASSGYENTGSATNPTWTAKSEWNVAGTSYARPAFADLDNDGDYDLMIGEFSGISYGYENTGTISSPTWTAKSEWNGPTGSRASPAFADLDNDDDYDLLIGDYNQSYGYENTGTISSPTWTAKSEWNVAGGTFARPAFADLDNDGDYDLLVGTDGGVIYGYENTGTISSPTWTAKSAWNFPDIGAVTAPAFADLDDDGDYDLLIGEYDGVCFAYEYTPGYYTSGTYTSAIKDLGQASWFAGLDWNAALPEPEGTTSVKFQIASSVDSIDWTEFLGPDGTTATYYTTSGQRISSSAHNGHQYIKYQATLATTDTLVTPTLNDVTINYQHSGLTTGAGTVTFSAALGEGVTLKTAGTQSVTATDTVTGTITGSQTVTVNGTEVFDHYEITAATPQTAGTGWPETLTACDVYGNTVTTYPATVMTLANTGWAEFYTADDYLTTTPTYTLSAGVATVYVKDAEAETITITATDPGSISGTSGSIVVEPTALALATLEVKGIADPVVAGTPSDVVVSALDANGNATSAYTGKITFSSSDPLAELPEDYWFLAPAGWIETSDTDFGAAGTVLDQAVISGTGTDAGVELAGRKLAPTSANLGAQQLLGTGSSSSDQAGSPDILQLSDGKYRVYYQYYDGTYWQLAYKETTDTNPPTSTNLDAQQLLGTGSSSSDQAGGPEILQLSDGKYRVYYHYKNGTYTQLAYKETTDTNPPTSANLGAQQLLGTGSSTSDQAGSPDILQLSDGKYRVYYGYSTGPYYQLAYKETTDTNPPTSANLGAQQLLGTGSSTSDRAHAPDILQLSDGKYRVYYQYYDGTYWQLAYKETTCVASGTYTSAIHDLGQASWFAGLNWNAAIPTEIQNQEISAAEEGLVGLWRMNNDWTDSSPYANNGTAYNGATFNTVNQKLGVACGSFDGVNDYVSVADAPNHDFTAAMSVEAWIKVPVGADNTTGVGLVMHDKSDYKWMLYLTSLSMAEVYIRTASGVSGTGGYASGCDDNQWHHLVGTYDRTLSLNRLKLYLDGTLVIQADGYDEDILAGDEGIDIGRWGVNYFNGLIDEVAIYNRALSAEEIYSHYAEQQARVKFQIASSADNITWTSFLGPDGTTGTYYTLSGQDISQAHNDHRYIKYQATLATTDALVTPTLNDVTVNYQHSGLTTGAGTVTFYASEGNGVTLKTTGEQSVTATDTENGAITGTQDAITVTSAAIDYYTVTAATPQTAGVAWSETVTAYDVYDNVKTDDPGTVVTMTATGSAKFYTDISGLTETTTCTLSGGTATIFVKDTVAEDITLTATDANAKTGTSDPITVEPTVADHIVLTGATTATAGEVSGTITITSYDIYENIAPVTLATEFSLSSDSAGTYAFYSDAGGTIVIDNVVSPATIAAAASSTTFYYKDTLAGTFTIIAVRTSGDLLGSDSCSLTVEPAAIDHYTVTTTTSQIAGIGWSETIEGYDVYENLATNASKQLTMTNSGNASFYTNDTYSAATTTYILSGGTATAYVKDTVAEDITITATDSDAITVTSGTITVNPASISSYTITTTTPQTIDVGWEETVTAKDVYGNTVSTGPESSTVITPANSGSALFYTDNGLYDTTTTLYALDSGVATLYIKDAAPEVITVSVSDVNLNSGTSDSIVVGSGLAVASLSVEGITDPITAGDSSSVTVTALDAGGNITADYSGTIHFTSSDTQAVLPEDFWFVSPVEWAETSDTDFGAAGTVLNQAVVSGIGEAAKVQLANAPMGVAPWSGLAAAPATVSSGGDSTAVGTDTIYAFRGASTTTFWKYTISTNTWTTLAAAPGTISYGGSLTAVGTDTIYAFRGFDTTTFWKYTISTNTWTTLAAAPGTVYPGGSLTTVGTDTIYAFRGDGATAFWKYTISTNTWTTLAAAPANVSSGGVLTTVGTNTIYAFRGGGSSSFWKYTISTNTWTTLAPAKTGVSYGGSLTTVGTNTIYAFSGGTVRFFKYTISTNTWTESAYAPTNVYYGGSLTTVGDSLYAFGGNGTTNFWKYNPAKEKEWYTMAPAPGTVYCGGSLTTVGDTLYALRGDTSTAFWKYVPSTNTWTALALTPATVYSGGALTTVGTDTLYALRGSGTTTFWKYTISTNTWTSLAGTPEGITEGALTSVGTDTIYALRGGYNTTGFYKYTISTNSWTILATIGASSSSGGGTSLTTVGTDPDTIYAFRGDARTSFYKYTISTNTWVALAAAPAAVSGGGSLTTVGTDTIYAFRGTQTTAFWKYTISTNTWATLATAPGTVYSGGALTTVGTDTLYAFRGYDTTAFWKYTAGYYSSGTFTSTLKDLGQASWFAGLNWNAATPAGTSVKFQLATATDEATPVWTEFLGPDGTTGTYYTLSGQDISSAHDNHRYVKYQATLTTTTDMLTTPTLNDVTVKYQYDGLAGAGQVVFSPPNGVTLKTASAPGTQRVTAEDTLDAAITGYQDVEVTPGAIDHYEVTATTPQDAGTGWSETVTAKDAYGNTVTDDPGTVVTLTNTGSALFYFDSSYLTTTTTYTLASGVIPIYLKDATAETITITATDGAGKTGTSGSILIEPGPPAQVGLSGPASVTVGQVSGVFTLTSQDVVGNTTNAGVDTIFSLSSDSGGTVTFYKDAGGTLETGTVTITSGTSSTVFYYKDTQVGTPTVTAAWSSGGTDLGSDTHQLTTNADTAVTLGITSTALIQNAGVSGTITVEVQDQYGNPQPAGAVTVNLASNSAGTYYFYSTGTTTEISSITIADAASSGTFDYYDELAGAPLITVTDAAVVLTQASQAQTINAASATKLVITSTALTQNAGEQGAITVEVQDEFDNPQASGAVATILTSTSLGTYHFYETGTTTVITGLTLADGVASASFDYYDEEPGAPTVSVLDNAGILTSATQAQTINPAVAIKLAITSTALTLTAGTQDTVTVEVQDIFSNPQTLGLVTVDLASNSAGTYAFYATGTSTPAITSITIADGASSGTFDYYDEKSATPTITVTDAAAALTQAAQAQTVNPAAAAKLAITSAALSMEAGVSGIVTVEVQDEFSNPQPSGLVTVALASDSVGTYYFYSTGTTVAISTINIADGVSSAAFDYNDELPGTPTITVTDTAEVLTLAAQTQAVAAAAPSYLTVTGAASMPAGSENELTIRAYDAFGNLAGSGVNNYTGSKTLAFSGPLPAPAAEPTVEAVPVGSWTPVGFSNGVSVAGAATLIAYKAEGTTVDVSDGTINSFAEAAYDLDLTVVAGVASSVRIDGLDSVTAGVVSGPFNLTAQDAGTNNATVSADSTFSLTSDSTGTFAFYSDSAGLSQITDAAISAGQTTSAPFYYKDTKSGTCAISAIWMSGDVLATGTRSVTVVAASAVSLDIGGVTDPITAGIASNVTVTLYDEFANVATGYTGTVRFESSDAQASLPTDYTFLTSNAGAYTFLNGVTLRVAGEHLVTATDTLNSALTDTQPDITVGPALASYFSFTTGDTTMTAGGTNELAVSAYDEFHNLATGYVGLKSLSFSAGPDTAPAGTVPTIEGVVFALGEAAVGSVNFTAGASDALALSLVCYKVESLSLEVTQGVITTTADATRDIDITVLPAVTASFSLNAPSDIVAGTTAGYTTTRYDAYGNLQTIGNDTVFLYTTSTGAAAAFKDAVTLGSTVTTRVITDGTNSVDFWYYDEKSGGWTITVSDAAPADGATGIADASDDLTVAPAVTTHFKVTSGAATVNAGEALAIIITAYDEFENIPTVYSGDKTLTFSGANASTDPVTDPQAADNTLVYRDFGIGTILTFTDGITTGSVKLYLVETANVKATEGVITTSTADALAVTVYGGTGTKLSWNTQPRSIVATNAVWAPFVIEVTDAYGNRSSSTSNVIVAPSAGAFGAGSTATVAAVDGLASFSNITYPDVIDFLTVTGSSAGLASTAASSSVKVEANYTITWNARDSVNGAHLLEVTVETWQGDTQIATTTGNSPFTLSLPYGDYTFKFTKEAYVESTIEKTAGVSADAADASYDNSITWTIYVMSISESLADYRVMSDFVYGEDTDTLSASMRLEKRGQQIFTDAINALGTAQVLIYDGSTLIGTLTDDTADAQGNYWLSVEHAVGGVAGGPPAGFTQSLVSGKSYFVRCSISYGGSAGDKITYYSGTTFDIGVTARLKVWVEEIKEEVSDVKDVVETEAGATRTAVATAKTSIESEVATKATATQAKVAAEAEETMTLIGSEDLKTGETLASTLVREAASRILNQESYAKENDTVAIRYKTDTGLDPVISVYDADNTLRIDEEEMEEKVSASGIYEYDVEFEWGLGEHTIICKETTKGTLDGVNIEIISTDLEQISTTVTTTMAQLAGIDTSELEALTASIEDISGVVEGIINSIDEISQLSTKVKELADKTTTAIYSELEIAMQKLKEINEGQGIKIEEMYDLSGEQATDVDYIKNKTLEIKALVELSQEILTRKSEEPIVKTWMESE